MTIYEISDPEEARAYVLQSLWLARSVSPSDETLTRTLSWAVEIASEGGPLPLLGFLLDVGHIALGATREVGEKQAPAHLDPSVTRRYEDYVLGKLYADMTFERGADALARYQGRDRDRGVAYLADRLRERAGFGGVILAPAVLRGVQHTVESDSAQVVLAEGWSSIEDHGFADDILEEFDGLINAVRNTGELLGAEDVFELESGTALEQFGQRVALRQTLQAAEALERSLPRERLRPLVKRPQVATHIADEDLYPVGGYTSLANRGSIESLLFSQLAYMENDEAERPDLFDIKYLRDELYYYSRDENQFLRRRQTLVIALYPDLIEARFKDAALPWQRIILVLAMIVVVVRKMIEWLSDHALVIEICFLGGRSSHRLEDEKTLLHTLLREQIANGTVVIQDLEPSRLPRLCTERGRRSLCHLLAVSADDRQVEGDSFYLTRLVTDADPALGIDQQPLDKMEPAGFDGWSEALSTILRNFI